jgi:hypothetical protein
MAGWMPCDVPVDFLTDGDEPHAPAPELIVARVS